jgi:3-oxoacyl-[acyl-carrier-protein] synthase II
MESLPIYVQSVKQISTQSPLSETWTQQPIRHEYGYQRSIDPDFKAYFTPNETRRMGKLLKRAIITSREAVKAARLKLPDAVITGTGLGSIENMGIFLKALDGEGDSALKPACFMQSTHNTTGSLIGIDLKCHGYNTTYSHKGISFESALLDAVMQLSYEEVNHVLVGAHDEVTPDYFTILQRVGYLGGSMKGFSGETSMSMILGKERTSSTLCRMNGIEMAYKPRMKQLTIMLERLLKSANCPLSLLDGVMIGVNGSEANDDIYERYVPELFGEVPLLRYKHLFGESYTAPALGFYVAAICLSQQCIPSHLFINGREEKRGVNHILLYNQFEGKNHSFILLSC